MKVCPDDWNERDVQKVRPSAGHLVKKQLVCFRGLLLLHLLEPHCFRWLLCSWRIIQLHFILQGFIIKGIYLLGISESLSLQCVYHAWQCCSFLFIFQFCADSVLLDLYQRTTSRYVCTLKEKEKKKNPLRFHGFHKAAAAVVMYLQVLQEKGCGSCQRNQTL